MSGCQTCGHSISAHRYEWDKFRGRWDRSCRSTQLGIEGRDRCPCDEYKNEETK